MGTARFVTSSGVVESYPSHVELRPILGRGKGKYEGEPLYLCRDVLVSLLVNRIPFSAICTRQRKVSLRQLVLTLAPDEESRHFIVEPSGRGEFWIGYGSDPDEPDWGFCNRILVRRDLLVEDLVPAIMNTLGDRALPRKRPYTLRGQVGGQRFAITEEVLYVSMGKKGDRAFVVNRSFAEMWRTALSLGLGLRNNLPGSGYFRELLAPEVVANIFKTAKGMSTIEFPDIPDYGTLAFSDSTAKLIVELIDEFWVAESSEHTWLLIGDDE